MAPIKSPVGWGGRTAVKISTSRLEERLGIAFPSIFFTLFRRFFFYRTNFALSRVGARDAENYCSGFGVVVSSSPVCAPLAAAR